VKELWQPYRCVDDTYQKILDGIRPRKPQGEVWKHLKSSLLRYRKAWGPHHEPTLEDVKRILKDHPNTTMLTVSREGANTMDDLALQAKHSRKQPLVTLEGDIESLATNYKDGRMLPKRQLKYRMVPIHKGMFVYLTRNIRKDTDYVNGMRCVVESYNRARNALVVVTATGKTISIVPEYHEEHDMTYFPIRPGYASTIMKFQGAELEHVTLYLDRAKVPAAAYTAMSRVKMMSHILIGGNVTPEHFVPARD
jgi:hypothetical protein